MAKKKPTYEELKHDLDSKMLQAAGLRTKPEQQGFINRTFTHINKLYNEKQISHGDYVKLINRLGAYRQGEYNDYIDTLAGAAQLGMLEVAIQGELSQMTPEAARQRRDAVTDLTGVQPVKPEPSESPLMRRYEQAIRSNMAAAEKDYKHSPEDRRGFVIGGVLQLWQTYHEKKQIDESQFDKLIGILAGFSGGEYRDFINDLVRQYKGGHPPTIIGY